MRSGGARWRPAKREQEGPSRKWIAEQVGLHGASVAKLGLCEIGGRACPQCVRKVGHGEFECGASLPWACSQRDIVQPARPRPGQIGRIPPRGGREKEVVSHSNALPPVQHDTRGHLYFGDPRELHGAGHVDALGIRPCGLCVELQRVERVHRHRGLKGQCPRAAKVGGHAGALGVLNVDDAVSRP